MSDLARGWQRPSVLEAIFDQLSDAVFLYDQHLHILAVNQAAERLFGMTADEIIGKTCQDLFHCSACDPDCGMRRAVGQSTGLPTGTVNLHLNNGRAPW